MLDDYYYSLSCCNRDLLNQYMKQSIASQINENYANNLNSLNTTIANSFNRLNTSMINSYTYQNTFCPYPNYTFGTNLKEKEIKKRSLIEELDFIIFPDNPIRDWADKQMELIDKKYDDIIKQFDLLLKAR